MTKQEELIHLVEKTDYLSFIDKFEDDYGELYSIIHCKMLNVYYLTGDELDWELGWRIIDFDRLRIVKEFPLNNDETKKIKKIVRKHRMKL